MPATVGRLGKTALQGTAGWLCKGGTRQLLKGVLGLVLCGSQQALPLGGALQAVLAHQLAHQLLVPELPDAGEVGLCQQALVLKGNAGSLLPCEQGNRLSAAGSVAAGSATCSVHYTAPRRLGANAQLPELGERGSAGSFVT